LHPLIGQRYGWDSLAGLVRHPPPLNRLLVQVLLDFLFVEVAAVAPLFQILQLAEMSTDFLTIRLVLSQLSPHSTTP